jgi:hypothetical protein
MADATSRRYRHNDITVMRSGDGSLYFNYGGSMGSQTFPSAEAAHTPLRDWLAARRAQLERQLAELPQIEQHLDTLARGTR